MPDGVVLSPELAALVQRMVRQYMNSFQPRPKRLRRLVRGTGGGEVTATSDIRIARVVDSDIPAAESNLEEDWTTGAVVFMSDTTGLPIDPESPVVVRNKVPRLWPVDSWVQVHGLDIINGTCGGLDGFWLDS